MLTIKPARRMLSLMIMLGCATQLLAQKPAMGHDVYEDWEILSEVKLTEDGNWAHYFFSPGKGDKRWQITSLDQLAQDSIDRVKKVVYMPGSQVFVLQQSVPFDSIRQAKLDKVPEDKLPQDTLLLYNPRTQSVQVLEAIQSFAAPNEGGDWIAYLSNMPKDTTKKPSRKKRKGKKKEKKGLLTVFNAQSGANQTFSNVIQYGLSPQGNALLFVQQPVDSVDSILVRLWQPNEIQTIGMYANGKVEHIIAAKSGLAFAFSITTDTSEAAVYKLQVAQLEQDSLMNISAMIQAELVFNPSYKPNFSESGERLFFELIEPPKEPAPDTLLKEEKVRVDVWHWQDKRLQPEQLVDQKADQERGQRAYWAVGHDQVIALGTEDLRNISVSEKGDGPIAIAYDRAPYQLEGSWSSPRKRDVYLVDMETGSERLLVAGATYFPSFSPGGDHVVVYDTDDRNWYSYASESGKKVNLTEDLKVNFFDEEHDLPSAPYPYRPAGFVDETHFLLLDRFDIWLCELGTDQKPVNLTNGVGRKENIRFRVVDVDREEPYLGDTLLIHGISEETKREYLYRFILGEKFKRLEPILEDDVHWGSFKSPDQAQTLLFSQSTFRDQPNLYIKQGDQDPTAITSLNPQAADYRRGYVSLVNWQMPDESTRKGLMYFPEGLKPGEKIPMVVYFYERLSQRLHYYYPVRPSRSTVNINWYTSNGYAVFVPDIHYQTGRPGPDALETVLSGTDAMVQQFPFLDSTKIGLQGQSWGGYQVAYIITQTNRFAAAMAGAPVSNMTSAYGGIRWRSGLSRMFQYERTQSRLGVALWEDPQVYLDNSPLFSLPNVQTPVMIMHNDNDGAVPWYQGIEMFVGLRRLRKPAWMVVYNDEAHNLTKWPNRVDLSIRMSQFFDYYLKGEPMPIWMKEGIPATEKGEKMGYELDR